jgi:hypothetical protein
MEQTIATAVTATPAAASGFADFFATIFAYVASIGLVKLMVSLFMQMVIAITTVLGVGSLTAQAILVFGLVLVVIGLVFSVGKLFDAGKARPITTKTRPKTRMACAVKEPTPSTVVIAITICMNRDNISLTKPMLATYAKIVAKKSAKPEAAAGVAVTAVAIVCSMMDSL